METIEAWIKKEQEPQTISLWGTIHQTDFVPELCSTIDGDGQQLIYFGTINQRPKYWLMQIDSKHNIEDNNFDIEKIVIENLINDFGMTEWIGEDEFDKFKNTLYNEYENYEEYMSEWHEYPRLNLEGYHWGLIANTVTGETE
jgi:hypothetical protein